jgi:hypothetical protein
VPVACNSTPREGARTGLGGDEEKLRQAITVIDEYKTPGLESELSGIYPHPTDSNLYYVLANQKPPYRHGQKPTLPEEYRGKMLTVNRQGEVVRAVKLAEDDFGGLVLVDGYAYAALTNGAEIVKANLDTGAILQHIPLPSPAGGLEYDKERDALIAQLYVGHPHLAVIDRATGKITEMLWSDESAMGLAKVDGDLLCTWASGWDPGSFSELRLLDPTTGKVRVRTRLEGVHSVLAPAKDDKGGPAFLCLVTVNSYSGETVVRRYGYVGQDRRAPQ